MEEPDLGLNETSYTDGLVELTQPSNPEIGAGDISISIVRLRRRTLGAQSRGDSPLPAAHLRVTATIRTVSLGAAAALAERVNTTNTTELSAALDVPVLSSAEISARAPDGTALSVSELRARASEIETTLGLLLACAAALVVSAASACYLWGACRRAAEQRRSARGTRSTLAWLAADMQRQRKDQPSASDPGKGGVQLTRVEASRARIVDASSAATRPPGCGHSSSSGSGLSGPADGVAAPPDPAGSPSSCTRDRV